MIALDIETMSTRSDAAVIAIGMVAFDLVADKVEAEFYIAIHLATAVRDGGVMDPAAVLFWFGQPQDVQRKWIWQAIDNADALAMANAFIEKHAGQVWARGPQFDCVILRNAMERIGITPAWSFRDERDARTLVNAHSKVPLPEFIGVKHFAIDDARNTVREVRAIYRATHG